MWIDGDGTSVFAFYRVLGTYRSCLSTGVFGKGTNLGSRRLSLKVFQGESGTREDSCFYIGVEHLYLLLLGSLDRPELCLFDLRMSPPALVRRGLCLSTSMSRGFDPPPRR